MQFKLEEMYMLQKLSNLFQGSTKQINTGTAIQRAKGQWIKSNTVYPF
jgi:hypothetical protein